MKALDSLEPVLGAAGPGVQWGLCIREVESCDVFASIDADVPMPTASVGKVFLLVELARAAATGERSLDPPSPAPPRTRSAIPGSGSTSQQRR